MFFLTISLLAVSSFMMLAMTGVASFTSGYLFLSDLETAGVDAGDSSSSVKFIEDFPFGLFVNFALAKA